MESLVQLDGIMKKINVFREGCDADSDSLIFSPQQPVCPIGPFRMGPPTAWILVDKAVADHAKTQKIIEATKANLGNHENTLMISEIDGGENCKSSGFFDSVCETALDYFGHAPRILIAIGGGSLLNLATFISATLEHEGVFISPHRTYPIRGSGNRIAKLVLVPTTILAIADVAYGSKGNIDMQNGENSLNMEILLQRGINIPSYALQGAIQQKHGWKLYRDPDEIFVSPAYIESLPKEEVLRGLSEVLKHALLQDLSFRTPQFLSSLFRDRRGDDDWSMDMRCIPSLADTFQQLRNGGENRMQCLRLSMQTMYAKSLILGADKWEESWIASLLSYGHLHAHAIEAASNYAIVHGESVFIGMMVDLKLGGSTKLYHKLLEVSQLLPISNNLGALRLNQDALKTAYQNEPKDFFKDKKTGNFKVLPLPKAGNYACSLNPIDPPPQILVTLEQILSAYETVLNDMEQQKKHSPSTPSLSFQLG